MKTVKRILFVFVITAFFIQCDDVNDVVDPVRNSEKFELESEVTNARVEINHRSAVTFTGKASCSLTKSIVYVLNGDVLLNDVNGAIKITNGQMKFLCLLSGSCLFGEFEGIGYIKEGEFRLEGIITITDGTHGFNDRSGSLSLLIKGEYLPDQEDIMNYTICIEGNLKCDA